MPRGRKKSFKEKEKEFLDKKSKEINPNTENSKSFNEEHQNRICLSKFRDLGYDGFIEGGTLMVVGDPLSEEFMNFVKNTLESWNYSSSWGVTKKLKTSTPIGESR